MSIEAAIEGSAIIINGNFTPKTFSAAWLRREGVIDDDELDSAESVLGADVAQFNLDIFQFQVVRDQFSLQTTQGPFVRIADIALKIFRDLLPHTPMSQMGINRTAHFDAGSRERRTRIGRTLVPPQPWGHWSNGWDTIEPKDEGGLINLAVINKFPLRAGGGFQQIHVQPSNRNFVSGGGVYVLFNDHYELTSDNPPALAASILESRFDAAMAEGKAMIDHIGSLGDKP